MSAELRSRAATGPRAIDAEVRRAVESGAFELRSAEEILGWAVERFHPRLALSASFGAPEGMVVLDLMHRIDPGARVFVLDTGRLPQSVHDLIDRVRDRYGKPVEVVLPQADDVQRMVVEKGSNLFYESLENRKLCCHIRKVEPLRRKLTELDAYVTGVRRDQGVTRTGTPKLQIDDGHGGVVKVNPIADWSADDVWAYVRKHSVPVNRLHANGFPSVGCEPCTRAVAAGEDPRSGRWWWENADTKECGLHVDEEQEGSGI